MKDNGKLRALWHRIDFNGNDIVSLRLPEGDSPPRLPEGPRGGREVRVRQLEAAVPGGRGLPPPLLAWWHQETQPPVPTCSQESCQCRTHDQVTWSDGRDWRSSEKQLLQRWKLRHQDSCHRPKVWQRAEEDLAG